MTSMALGSSVSKRFQLQVQITIVLLIYAVVLDNIHITTAHCLHASTHQSLLTHCSTCLESTFCRQFLMESISILPTYILTLTHVHISYCTFHTHITNNIPSHSVLRSLYTHTLSSVAFKQANIMIATT